MDLRKLMALMAAALLLSSCSNDEGQEVSQPVPIRLTTTMSGESTRAADGINDSNFPYETPITVSVDGSNYNYKTDDDNVSDPMVCQDATPPYFPVSGSSVHIVAYYPSSMTYSTSVQTFTVKHDQSQTTTGTANYKASDLMVGLPKTDFVDDESPANSLIEGTGFTRKVKYTTKTIPLEFEHRLAKIRIKCTTNGATVKKVEMTNIQRSIVFNSSDNTFGALSTATDDVDNTANTIIMYNDATTGSNTDFYCAAIIPMQSLAVGTAFITITTSSGVPLVYKLPDDLDPSETMHNFESGKQYNFNVNINDYELTVTSTITNWTDAVDGTDFTHGDGLAFIPNYMKLPLWYMAEYNMTSATSMASTENDGYFYSWSDAMSLFAASTTSYTTYACAGKKINGESYHLPVRAEWWSISPGHDSNSSSLWPYDNGSGTYKSNYITPVWGYNSTTKAGVAESSYWKYISSTEMHAIRFLGTEFCSAWKYVKTGNSMIIYATLIDKVENNSSAASTWYASNFSSVTFGDYESLGAVRRTIYARGERPSSGSGNAATAWANTYGYYWSATEVNGSDAYGLHINPYDASGGTFVRDYPKNMGESVRLFRDN